MQTVTNIGQAAAKLRASENVDLFFRKIDCRLDVDTQVGEPVGEVGDPFRKQAVERSACGAGSGIGTGGDQIGDRFGLGQIELAVEEGTFGEFAGPRWPRPQFQTPSQHRIQQVRIAVSLQFEGVFTGVGGRAGKQQQQSVIQNMAHAIVDAQVMRVARTRWTSEQAPGDGRNVGTGKPDDADAGRSRRRGDRRDRVADPDRVGPAILGRFSRPWAWTIRACRHDDG